MPWVILRGSLIIIIIIIDSIGILRGVIQKHITRVVTHVPPHANYSGIRLFDIYIVAL